MEFNAIEFNQNGTKFYITVLPARVLIDPNFCKVDIWDPEIDDNMFDIDTLIRIQGYQRAPIRSHYSKVKEYLLNFEDAILPTAVLLSARYDVEFVRNGNSNTGKIIISEDKPLYIIDGQHRIYGIRAAIETGKAENLYDFPLPCIILSNIDKVVEIRQFYTVNSTQKRVRTDLAENLLKNLALKDEREKEVLQKARKVWIIAALNIANQLNSDPESPWYKRIRKPNQDPHPNLIVSQHSFITSLAPVIKTFYDSKTEDEIATWINNFWKALRNLMPEAFDRPREFVIQKTPGIYSLHMVLPSIIIHLLEEGDLSASAFKKFLMKDPDHFLDPGFWRSGEDGAATYNSMGAFRTLAEEIREELFGS